MTAINTTASTDKVTSSDTALPSGNDLLTIPLNAGGYPDPGATINAMDVLAERAGLPTWTRLQYSLRLCHEWRQDDQDCLIRYRAWRDALVANDTKFAEALLNALPPEVRTGQPRMPTAEEWDFALDSAITTERANHGARSES